MSRGRGWGGIPRHWELGPQTGPIPLEGTIDFTDYSAAKLLGPLNEVEKEERSTEVLVGRFLAGETTDELAVDLDLEPGLIQEAVRWEQLVAWASRGPSGGGEGLES